MGLKVVMGGGGGGGASPYKENCYPSVCSLMSVPGSCHCLLA